ncbi:hypothetical protein D3C76_1498370 [compost metagenome]
MSVSPGYRRRHGDLHAMRLPYLPGLHRHGHRSTEDGHVVDHPNQADHHRHHLVRWAVEKAPHAKTQASQIEYHQQQVRPGDHPIDMLLRNQPAFGGDVELAFVRVEQSHGGRPGDIPGQHGFVDFTPEGVAVFALNT